MLVMPKWSNAPINSHLIVGSEGFLPTVKTCPELVEWMTWPGCSWMAIFALKIAVYAFDKFPTNNEQLTTDNRPIKKPPWLGGAV